MKPICSEMTQSTPPLLASAHVRKQAAAERGWDSRTSRRGVDANSMVFRGRRRVRYFARPAGPSDSI